MGELAGLESRTGSPLACSRTSLAQLHFKLLSRPFSLSACSHAIQEAARVSGELVCRLWGDCPSISRCFGSPKLHAWTPWGGETTAFWLISAPMHCTIQVVSSAHTCPRAPLPSGIAPPNRSHLVPVTLQCLRTFAVCTQVYRCY